MKKKETADQVDKRLQVLVDLKARMREEVRPDPSDPSYGHVQDMTERFPLLSAAIHAHLYEGGPEKGATITIWGDIDGLGGVFSLEALGIKRFFKACSIQEAFLDLEEALANPNTKWMRAKPYRAKQRHQGKPGKHLS